MKISLNSKFNLEDKKKIDKLITKTIVSCTTENKCYFELVNNFDGSITLKSPRTRNLLVKYLKILFSD